MAKTSKLFKSFLGMDITEEEENDDNVVDRIKETWEKRNKDIKDSADGRGKKSLQKKLNDRAKLRGIELSEEEIEDFDKVLDKIEDKAKESVKSADSSEPSEMSVKSSKVFKDYEQSVAIREAANKEAYDKKIKELEEQIEFTGIKTIALDELRNINYVLPKDKKRAENLKTQYLNEFKGITLKVDDKGVKTFFRGDERIENEAGKALTETEIAEQAASKWLMPTDEAELESKDSPGKIKSDQTANTGLQPTTETEFTAIITRPGISVQDQLAAKKYYLDNKKD